MIYIAHFYDAHAKNYNHLLINKIFIFLKKNVLFLLAELCVFKKFYSEFPKKKKSSFTLTM